nr:sensor histidine kinase [Gordonia otitidis]
MGHMHTSPLTPVVAGLRWGLHLLAVALTAVVMARALIASPADIAAAVVAAVWLAVYFAGGLALGDRRRALAWLTVLTTVWLVELALTPEATYLVFVLFFLYLHLLGRRRGSVAVVLATAVAVIGYAAHSGWSAAAVIGPVLGAGVAVVISAGYAQLFAEAAQRERLIDELVTARADLEEQQQAVGRAAERERLAAEIHDTVAQSLSSIQLLLHAAEQATGERAQVSIALARTAAANALTETRRLIAELSPAPLDGSSLADALRRVAADAAGHGIDTSVVIEGDVEHLAMPTEAALVRIAQGAVSNVVRHSQATALHLTLTYTDDDVHLDIVDDGTGFAPDTSEGYGLTTIRRRVADLGGIADVSSDAGGTTVAVSFPLAPEPADESRTGAADVTAAHMREGRR